MGDFQAIRRQLERRLATPRRLPIERDRVPQAAVSLILSEAQGAARALIIKRAERPGDHWSGHLALPGGRAQDEDGIDLLDGGEFIGQLEILVPTNRRLPRLEITPFVAIAPPEFTLRLNGEVARAFWISVADLKRVGRSSFFSMP